MSGTYPGPIDRLRRPEYTGENRCMPCTIVNTVIALGLSVTVAAVVAVTQSVTVGLAAGGVVFAVCAIGIALRGYLVPKTPYITKNYFPRRVLRWFEKEPPAAQEETGFAAEAEESDYDDRFDRVDGDDVEEILVNANALEACQNVDDLCVTPSFRDAWRDNIHAFRDTDGDVEYLADMVETDPDGISVEIRDNAYEVKDGRRRIGQWESEAAFLADMAAARTLSETYDGWSNLGLRAKSGVLNGVRVFLEHCPTCDGIVTIDEETVETCCREFDVTAVLCQDCGAHLFETGHDSPKKQKRKEQA